MSEERGVTVICENCGEMIEVKDVRALILSLHLTQNCPQTEVLRAPS